ncbi:HlyD family efflux transporter periplasmic adaptor subunit [Zymobacter sp. IVIA_12111.31 C1]|uniref:HlyD family efflux transporter periplasmic adaptor subunit n=1 Tax=Zymobacter sp. IVIA_12111.31 C1 TaxID=3394854 RepID=UPI0039C01879
MKKKQALVVAVIVVVVAGLCAGAYWRRSARPQALTLYGNVDIRQVSLAFENGGRIAAMNVEEGDRVTAGQVLAKQDTRTLQLELQQSEAQVNVLTQSLRALHNGSRPQEVEQANAQVAAADAEVARSRQQLQRLLDTAAQTDGRAVGQQALDDARAQLKVALAQRDAQHQAQQLAKIGPREEEIAKADAQLQAAQSEQALRQHLLDLSELRAPQNAVVRARLLEPGDMASPQRPAYTIALTEPKWVRAYASESELGRIKPGMAANVYIDSAPDRAIAGRVGFISSVAEFTPKSVQTEELRTSLVYEVRVLVDDPQDALRLGMPATVRFAETTGGAEQP